MNKIKIGKIANSITNVLFMIWAVFMIAGTMLSMKVYIAGCAILMILFAITVIVGHVCLKDYKEENYTEELY